MHSYADHASLLDFIEKNRGLPAISSRSRDHPPNPVTATNNPFVPANGPAIDDVMNFFRF